MPRRPPLPCGVWFCPVPMRLLWPIKAVSLDRIGAIYGRSRPEIERRARQLGLWDDRRHRAELVYSVAEFRRMWLDPKMTKPKIGARFGMNRAQVWQHAQRLGLPPRKPGRVFVHVFGADFDALWRAGVLAREMARHYGCSVSLISHEAARRGLPRRTRSMPQGRTMLQYRLAQTAAETTAALHLSEMVDLPFVRPRKTPVPAPEGRAA